jgi:dihydroxyacetone kinase phosphoprotein-dependent L subunit
MQALSVEDVELVVRTMADVAIANERYFSELDSAAGDADFGVSLAAGFKAILSSWEQFDRSAIGPFLLKAATTILSKVGGCSGPIWGTAFMRAGLGSKGKDALTRDDLVALARSAIEGIRSRGGAALGDKTLLDALGPATDALEKADPDDLLSALQAAADVAAGQIEATRGWEAKRGRQSFVGERSRGTLDPGIVAVATMMQEASSALRQRHGQAPDRRSSRTAQGRVQ